MRWQGNRSTRSLATGPREEQDDPLGTKEKKVSLSGSKAHPLGYAHVGRGAKKEIVANHE